MRGNLQVFSAYVGEDNNNNNTWYRMLPWLKMKRYL